jgi:polysaccharide biosynthesis transport protein
MKIGARDVFRILLKSIIAVTVTSAIAMLICIFAPVSYQATAMLLVNPGQNIESDANRTLAAFARQEQKINSLVEVLRSSEVVGRAIDKFGAERLLSNSRSRMDDYPEVERMIQKLGARTTAFFTTFFKGRAPRDEAVLRVTKRIAVVAQPKSDLISISYQHENPQVAADFTNTLLDVFRSRIMELYDRAEADAFFSGERNKYVEAFEASSDRLSAFAIANNAYSIEEQRKLTLERRNELLAAAVKTRSGIVEKESQASATAIQVSNLAPIAKFPQIRDLAQSVPRTKTKSARRALPQTPDTTTTPPLLLVRVYQEAVQSLVQLKSDVAGLEALEGHQRAELMKVDAELQKLAENEAKFVRLKLEVDQAKNDSQQYSSLASKEHLNSEANERGLSTIEIAQPAIPPTRPSFPNPSIILPIGALVGLLIGFGIPLFRLIASRIRNFELEARQLETVPWELPSIERETRRSIVTETSLQTGWAKLRSS